jgi:flagellar P-ring protein precursor FlgI
MINRIKLLLTVLLVLLALPALSAVSQVTVKDVARINGVRDTALVGYGLVTGLAGSGDSARFSSTSQSLKSVLRSFNVNIEDKEVQSRNVAAVIVTAAIPAFAEIGDKLDVQVSSLGDARSLAGGTLLLSPLKAPNDEVYALAQGQITVGGYRFEQDQNLVAKNHATVGSIIRGATTERSVVANVFADDGSVSLILNTPDFTMLDNITTALRYEFPTLDIRPAHAGKLDINGRDLSFSHLARIEQVSINVAQSARIVVNERSGIIVSGADIPVSSVVISHGNINLKISSSPRVSQPYNTVFGDQSNIKTVTVRDTEIEVNEQQQAVYINKDTTTIAEVVSSLQKLNIPTRDMISILEGLKRSGALHAEIVIQ